MTEVMFGLSVAFVGYVVYVLVDEQMASPPENTLVIMAQPPTDHVPVDERVEAVVDLPIIYDNPIPKISQQSTRKPTVKPSEIIKNLNMSELVGSAAGSIYRYLDNNGATSVAKLVRDIPEDNKLVQRAIGWLAQEGKITLDDNGRTETIGLQD